MYSNEDLEYFFGKYLDEYTVKEIQALIQEIYTRDLYLKKHVAVSDEIGRVKRKYNKGLDLIERDIFLDTEEREALEILRQAINRHTATSPHIKNMSKKKIEQYAKGRDYKNLIKDIESHISHYL